MAYEHEESFSITELHKNPTLTLALQTIDIGKQALVFVASRASAEKVAETIAKKAPKGGEKEAQIASTIRSALSRPTKQCERLAKCLENGIAFHHSGLVAKQREAIEDGFRAGIVKVICCTPTLAAGVDMPAFRTILKDLKRYAGSWGMQWIPTLEYEQMCGRAGRPGQEDYGEAIAIAGSDGEHDEILTKYVFGHPEDIYSKLAVEPVLRTYLLSLIVSGIVRDTDQIHSFFEKTFWAHQYGDMEKLQMIIKRVLDLLEEYEFIRKEGDDKPASMFSSADSLGSSPNIVYKATILGSRVSQLYLDPLTAHYLIQCLKRSHSIQATPFSLLQMVSYTLEMRPLLTVRTKEYEFVQEELNKHYSNLLAREPPYTDPSYDEFLQSVKTALLLHDWVEEKDEDYLLEHYNSRPGEIHAKKENADWLLYATEEIAKLLAFQDMSSAASKMRYRLKYGVKEELFALLKLKNIGRVRARTLYNNKVKNLGDIKSTDFTTLAQLIGKAVAADIKRQVGEEVVGNFEEVPKRQSKKGQASLMDYHES